jgi:uncharacterized membrane protein
MLKTQLSQTTKSLIYLSLLCVCLEIVRLYYSENIKYIFLIWNLFLAWVPFFLTKLAQKTATKSKMGTILLLCVWLLFFPNSPYIITDLLHLNGYKQDILWFDTLLIFLYAATGLLISLNSLHAAQQIFKAYFGKTTTWFILFTTTLLSGFGIYLGRYCRLNSWDLFSQPLSLFSKIFHQFENPLTFKITFLYGLVLLGLYLIFYDFYTAENKTILK